MSGHNNESCRTRNVAALAVWEMRAARPGAISVDHQMAVESKLIAPWTDFHVFSAQRRPPHRS